MTGPLTPADFAQFFESLKISKEAGSTPVGLKKSLPGLVKDLNSRGEFKAAETIDMLLGCWEIAEANAKPSDLLEKVKTCIRVGMDAEGLYVSHEETRGIFDPPADEAKKVRDEIRKLCEASK